MMDRRRRARLQLVIDKVARNPADFALALADGANLESSKANED